MPFKAILKKLVEDTPHAGGAILADWEGEAVEQHCLYDDFELKLLGAHKGIILNRMKELHADLTADEMQYAVITTGEQQVIIGAVGPDYSLVMTLAGEATLGLALLRFKQATKLLMEEIY
ncbi:MAG TPA: roadblock/LC7 domain-containing protein [Geobacteraceae bacterium]|nr:roadblock/LC7 domain-containing protein [Geobacteraceae bacterium]